MRPTRRGVAVLGVVVASAMMGWAFGGRSLNAVVVPGLVALAAGVVQVWMTDPPTVEHRPVDPVGPGQRATVTLDLGGGTGTAVSVRGEPTDLNIRDVRVDGTEVDARSGARSSAANGIGYRLETALPATIEVGVSAPRRGIYELCPGTLAVRDWLGLVERRHETSETAEVVIHPPVERLAQRARAVLARTGDGDAASTPDHDRVREYRPGDSPRRIHWKTSASQPDGLYVADPEGANGTRGSLRVAVTGDDGVRGDDLATAAASVVTAALGDGFRVALTTPTARVPAGHGEDQRERLLTALARLAPGGVAREPSEFDLVITGRDGDVVLEGSDTSVSLTGVGPSSRRTMEGRA